MMREATGITPIHYAGGGTNLFCLTRNPQFLASAPPRVLGFERQDSAIRQTALATDDWPYLYLSRKTVPGDYLLIIGSLLVLSFLAVLGLRLTDPSKKTIDLSDGHFFFMGVGFLLLETRSIGDCSLYFGTTWVVTLIVVTGVLLMVLAANLLATRLRGSPMWLYIPLIASLVGLYFAPRDLILGWPLAGRLLWAIFAVPLPIFFAGLIFSTTFRQAIDSASLLGANLIGATIGGFLEYLSMAVGMRALMLVVIGAYVMSWLCRRIRRPSAALSA
jgi:hypothetical protein